VALRVAVLGRPDAFGLPFVGKFDWYIFHAASFDLRWVTWLSLPFVAHVVFWETRKAWWARTGLWALYAMHSLLLVATVIDDETYRFMGCHLTPSLFTTYGNRAAIRQVFTFLANDKGGRYLPAFLLLTAVPLAAWLQRGLGRCQAFGTTPKWKTILIWAMVANGVGWLYTEVIWGGGFRARKLSPVQQVWWIELRQARSERVGDAEFSRLRDEFRERWLKENPEGAWRFPDSTLPYWKVPVAGESVAPPDSQWNVVLIVLESHRALNCGFLKAHGAARDATPFLDSVAMLGEYWTRYQCPALPTVRALASIHMGILNHPSRNFTSDLPGLANQGLPAILGARGWTTRFFSAADPAWDNQTPWLRQWYQGFDYDRFRERDADLFSHGATWMRQNLSKEKPFFVAFMSKTNHYPFNREEGVGDASSGDLQARMVQTMRYTDRAVRGFVDSLRREPWFGRTVFVVTGDHGFPLNEHGSSNIGFGLYSESVWLPLVVFGNHPKLHPGSVHAEPASHLDLGLTILDLAGVRAANHFTGRDLLLPAPECLMRTATQGDELLAVTSTYRMHGSLSGGARERGQETFASQDIQEQNAVKPDSGATRATLEAARQESRLLEAVLQHDALAPKAEDLHGSH
jgi:arylsulfatase A-like enzyme